MDEMIVRCPQCGAENELGTSLCIACSEPLGALPPQRKKRPAQETPVSVEAPKCGDAVQAPAFMYSCVCGRCGKKNTSNVKTARCAYCKERISDSLWETVDDASSATPTEKETSSAPVVFEEVLTPQRKNCDTHTLHLMGREKDKGREIVIDKDDLPAVVGATSLGSEFLTDIRVSREHFKVYCSEGGAWMLEDLSLNHTFIDGEQLEKNMPVPLRSNTIITLGCFDEAPKLAVRLE